LFIAIISNKYYTKDCPHNRTRFSLIARTLSNYAGQFCEKMVVKTKYAVRR
jgi:hypothetical protein